MFACICNAVRDEEVARVIAEGVGSVDDVYRRLGVEPQCRSCESHIEQMMVLVPVAAKLDAA